MLITTTTANPLIPPGSRDPGIENFSIPDPGIGKTVRDWKLQMQHHSAHIVRVIYIRIYMLFLFPVKDGKLSTGVNGTFNASCYGWPSTI